MPQVDKFTEDKLNKLKLAKGQLQCDWFETLFKGRSLIFSRSYGQLKGRGTWSVLFYNKGKPRRRKLGDWPAMTVASARKAAREFNAFAELNKIEAGSFKDVAEQWLKHKVDANAYRSAYEIKRHLKTYVYPRWASKPFVGITREDVSALLDDIIHNAMKRGRIGKSQADDVLSTISALMAWWQTRSSTYHSPIVKGMRRGKSKPRDRWLTDDEIRQVWNASDQVGGSLKCLIKLALLTGQRRDKLLRMKWSDIRGGEWHIAKEEREKGTPSRIKLSDMALDILRAQPRFFNNPYVHAGVKSGEPLSNFDTAKKKLDELTANIPHWTLHDLRRTFRALLSRRAVDAHGNLLPRVPTDVAELCLGHSLKGIRATYDNPEEYTPDVEAAFAKVADEVAKILNAEAEKAVA